DLRLRRPPRQRHPAPVRGSRGRPLREHPPVPLLPGHRGGGRGGARRGARGDAQRAAAGGHRRRGIRRGDRRANPAGSARVPARHPRDLGRVRRLALRPARRHGGHRRGLRGLGTPARIARGRGLLGASPRRDGRGVRPGAPAPAGRSLPVRGRRRASASTFKSRCRLTFFDRLPYHRSNDRRLGGRSMKRHQILAGAVFALILAAPAQAAAPFGSFGGKINGGNAGVGVIGLFGWALDDGGIAAVDILVDGAIIGRSTHGRGRPEVARQFPGFPNSAAAGFVYQLDTTRFLNGNHTVQPRVLSLTGEVTLLNSRKFQFNNITHNLIPFGRIDFPNQTAEMRGKCHPPVPPLPEPRRLYTVSGWALDSGVQDDDTGVGYVELMIDRAVYANTQSDCFYSRDTGGLTQCYGMRRLNIEKQYRGLPDSPHAGWRFVLDIGALMAFGYGPGLHTLTVRSGDLFGQTVNIAEMPVTFSCDED